MESLLLPFSMFTKQYFRMLPGNFSEISTWLIFAFGLYYFFKNKNFKDENIINFKALIFALSINVIQLITMVYFQPRIATLPASAANPGVFHAWLDFTVVELIIVMIFLIVRQNIYSDKALIKFFKVFIITFIIYMVAVLLPQLIGTLTKVIDPLLNVIGKLFEQRWQGRNFYVHGSYVTTLRRINGFAPEAGYLASQIGIVFIPVILACIKNEYDFFGKYWHKVRMYWILLILSIIVLFFAKTSTGFYIIGITALMLLFCISKKDRHIVYIFAGVAVGILLVGYIFVSPIRDLIDQYLFHKTGTSNRIGGTKGLLYTFLHYPITGVGNSMTNYFLLKYVPWSTRFNSEYFAVYSASGYPILSNFMGWFAQFGLIIMAPIAIYIVKKVKDVRLILSKSNDILDNSTQKLYRTIMNSFVFFLIMYLCLSPLIFTWNENYYVIMFFVYVVTISRLKSKLGLKL